MGLAFVLCWSAVCVLAALVVGTMIRLYEETRRFYSLRLVPSVLFRALVVYPYVGARLIWCDTSLSRRKRIVLALRWAFWCVRNLPIVIGCSCRDMGESRCVDDRLLEVWRTVIAVQ